MVVFAAVSNPWIFALIGVGLIKLVIDGERLFYVRDSILKQIYEENRGLWYQLGKPTGRIWQPRGENANVMHGTLYRPLWTAGSKIEEYPRVHEKFKAQISISRQLKRVDMPLLIVGLILAFFFSIK